MKKTSKIISLLLGASMLASMASGCAGGGNSNITKINVLNFGGGVGSVWLENAIERFEEEYKDKSYADGKKGVKVSYDARMGVLSTGMSTAGDMVYFDESSPASRGLIASGDLLDISDIVTPIEDKILPQTKDAMKGNNGKYYALPHYEYYFGLAYNIDVFERYNLYFSAPEETRVVNYPSAHGAAKFIKDPTGKKACGVDGEYGTYDDGLPTSLQELMILCDYMKMSKNVTPFVLSGKYTNYSIYMNSGLWTSLAGFDEISTLYSFDGNVELVTGYSSENLLPGVSIPKPTTTTEKITLETGYKVYDSAARYYSLAMLKQAMDAGWFSTAGLGSSVSHTGAQARFILSGVNGAEEVAMLVEGSYWYSESQAAGNFDDYEMLTGQKARIGWMPLPTSLNTTVTPGNGSSVALLDSSGGSCYINANIADNPELVAACKDFVSFCYRENELKEFTKTTGIARGMIYSMEEADFEGNTYGSTLWDLRDGGKNVVFCSATNDIFRSSPGAFEINLTGSAVFKPVDIEGRVTYASYYHAFKEGGMTCAEILEQTKLSTEAAWKANYGQFFNK